MKYSIVTPVYNSFSHMHHYFETIQRLSNDIEIIMVDDCSTDNTFEKICEYQKNSALNIHILQTPCNGGPGVARNIGMNYAHGTWIVFLDSDDSLREDFFEQLDKLIGVHNPDCVIYDSELYDKNNNLLKKKKVSVYGNEEGFLSVEDAIAYSIPGIRKCFKRELLQNGQVSFSDFRRGEDFLFYTMLFSSNPQMSIYYSKQKLYQIRQRSGSLSRTAQSENVMPAIFAYLDKNISKEYANAIENASVRLYLYGGLLILIGNRVSQKEIRSYIAGYEAMYPNWYRSVGMNILGKNKIIFLTLAKYRCILFLRMYVTMHKYLITR